MNKYQNALQNAVKQVLLVLENNLEMVQSIPVFMDALNNLKLQAVQSDELLQTVKNTPLKYGKNTHMSRAELIAVSLKVSNPISVFATITKNETLLNELAKSELGLKAKSDAQLLEYCKSLIKLLEVHHKVLRNYGLTLCLENDLKLETEDFEKLLLEPSALKTERPTHNELLCKSIESSYDIISKQIDPMMELFRDEKAFYISYQSARVVIDPRDAKRKIDSNTQPNIPFN